MSFLGWRSRLHTNVESLIAITQLLGAILFTIGSAAFVWMSFAEEWVLPLRLGCGLWIGGGLLYLWPPLRSEWFGTNVHASNALQTCAMLNWVVGSAFSYAADVARALPGIVFGTA